LGSTGVTPELQETLDLLARHEGWRASCLNMIASENLYSPSLLRLLSSDLEQRYASYRGRAQAQDVPGTRFVRQIEDRVEQLVMRVFRCSEVELRAISGHVAGVAVLAGLARPGDTVLELSRADGGHALAARMVAAPLFDLDVHGLAFDPHAYNIDVDRALEQVKRLRPRLVILGSSLFLFPHPIAALASAVHERDGLLLYDASHVLGLMAGGRFQQPLGEGADLVFGSTHKTFPGPQGGLIFGNDRDLVSRASVGVYPALVTNHHVARMPAMALALAEMERWGVAYADRVVDNARALGEALSSEGLSVVAADRGWTASHTVLVVPLKSRTAAEWAHALEVANIVTTPVALPSELGGEGVRIGTQEVTRRGGQPEHMRSIAALIARVLRGENPELAAPESRELAGSLSSLAYSVDAPSDVDVPGVVR
jgi:glycine hydroxymethyltransferase